MPTPQKTRLTKRADDWRRQVKLRHDAQMVYEVARRPRYEVNTFKPNVSLDPSQVTDRRGQSWYGPPNMDINILQKGVMENWRTIQRRLKP